MPISLELLDQIRHVVRPIVARMVGTVARGVVRLVDDSTKMQLIQIAMAAGETLDGAEHFQSYGFSSVPLAGAEHVTLFPGGDRSHPLTIMVADRRYKPTGRQPGDVTMHHYKGAKVTMNGDGNIEIQPAPGGQVFIRQPGGAADRVVLKSDFDNHKHDAGTLAAPNGAVTGETGGAEAATGSQTLQVQ